MKRFSITLFVLLFVMAAGLAAQDVTIIKVKVQAANVRSQPDMNGPVIRQVKLGMLLESRQRAGEWYEVTLTDERGGDVKGFINAMVVDVVSGGGAGGGQTGGQQAQVKKPAEGAPTVIVQQQVQQAQANTQTNQQTQYSSRGAGGSGGFKIMGGLGMANISLTWPADTDPETKTLFDKYKQSRIGYNGGIGVEMGGRIGLEIDVLYLQKGAQFKGTYEEEGESTTFDFNVLLEEISLPVMLKFHVLDQAAGPDIYLMGGGEIAYVLGGKTTYSYTSAGETEKGSEKIEKENLNQIDYGAILGAGVGLKFGGMQFFVEGRYHIGMSNLEKSSEGTVVESEESTKPKTSLLLLMAGIKF